MVLVTSVLAIICLLFRHSYKLIWFNTYFGANQKQDNSMFAYYNRIIESNVHSLTSGTEPAQYKVTRHSYKSISLVFEILMMCIFPWPFYETYILFNYTISGGIGTIPRTIVAEYFLGDFFLAFMFLRVYQILRCVMNYCLYTDAFSKKLCETYGFENGISFAIKCLLRIYPARIILLNFAVFTMLYSYLLRLFELPVLKHIPASFETLDQFFNAAYVTIITITTVGYGDITPISYFGRATMMLAALHGALMISLVVLTVSNFLELSDNQLLVFRRI